MPVKFDKDALEHLASAIRSQQTSVDTQVRSLMTAATRDPSGWDGGSGHRYDDQLSQWGHAQQQLDTAMTAMARVIDSIAAGITDIDDQAMQSS